MRKFFLLGVGVGFILSGILFSLLPNNISLKKIVILNQGKAAGENYENRLPNEDGQVYDMPPDVKVTAPKDVKVENNTLDASKNEPVKEREYYKPSIIQKQIKKIEVNKNENKNDTPKIDRNKNIDIIQINSKNDKKETEATYISEEIQKTKSDSDSNRMSRTEIVKENAGAQGTLTVQKPSSIKNNETFYLQIATYKAYSFGEKLVREMKEENINLKIVKKGNSYKVISEDINGYDEALKSLRKIEQKYKIKGIAVKK